MCFNGFSGGVSYGSVEWAISTWFRLFIRDGMVPETTALLGDILVVSIGGK